MTPQTIPIQLSGATPDEGEALDLLAYWQVVARHKVSIVGLALLMGLVAIYATSLMRPVYKSTALLLIEPQSTNVVSIKDVYGASNSRDYTATQVEILKSRLLAEKVIRELNLKASEEFKPKERSVFFDFDWRGFIKGWLPGGKKSEAPVDEEEAELNRLVAKYLRQLDVTPIKKSQLVKISFSGNDRLLTAQVANAHAEAYIENDMEARLQMTTKAAGWLTGRLESLREKLRKAETNLQSYREAQQLIEVGGVSTLTAQNLQELNQKLVLAQQRQTDAAEALRQIKKVKGGSLEQLESLPAVLEDDLIVSLMQAEAKANRTVSTLKKRYGPMHPKMIQALADLKEAKSSVQKRINDVLRGVEKEFEAAKASTRSVERLIAKAKNEMQSINRKSYQLGVLEREVDSSRQIYDLFLGREKETNETVGLEKAYARVADPAVAPIRPWKPKKGLIVAVTIMAGLILGVLLSFLREHLDNTIKSGGDLERRLGVAVLGVLPFLKLKGEQSLVTYTRTHPKSFFSESIRTIRTGIVLSSLDEPHKIVVVTSSIPKEGKSTVSMNLAESLGELYKVLLIDADMRRPTVAANWGLGRKTQGLSEYVSGTATLSECIHSLEGSNAMVMPSGLIPPNPLELLSSKRFKQALEKLSQIYDHIIIDSAPTLAVSDSLVLSSYANGVVFIAMSDSTPTPVVQDGLKRLKDAKAHIIGGVLNGIVQSEKGKYGYSKYNYYRGGYYSSYGYSSDS